MSLNRIILIFMNVLIKGNLSVYYNITDLQQWNQSINIMIDYKYSKAEQINKLSNRFESQQFNNQVRQNINPNTKIYDLVIDNIEDHIGQILDDTNKFIQMWCLSIQHNR